MGNLLSFVSPHVGTRAAEPVVPIPVPGFVPVPIRRPHFPGPVVERTPAQNPPTGRANSLVVTGVCDCLVLSTFVSVFVITVFSLLPKVAGHVVETMRCRWVATDWGCKDWARKALAELSASIVRLRVAPGVDIAVLRSRCFFPLSLCWEAFANKSTVGASLRC